MEVGIRGMMFIMSILSVTARVLLVDGGSVLCACCTDIGSAVGFEQALLWED